MKISDAITLLTSIFNYNLGQYEKSLRTGKNLTNTYIIPFFVGDPGLGKTAIPKHVAAQLGVPYFQTIIAQFDAGELAGLPFMTKMEVEPTIINADGTETKQAKVQVDRMIRLRPTYLPDPMTHDGKIGIYNLDELPQAFLANQNICSQLVNEYRVGEHEISPGITICCTGNKPENKAGTTSMPMHLRDRLMFIEIEADHDDFLRWATINDVDPRVRAYIKENPKYLHKFEPGLNAFPSPRSWDKTSAILSMELPKHLRAAALRGQIGDGVTTHFEQWLRVEDRLPKLQDVIDHPDKVEVFGNKDASILYLLLANLADVANKENIGNIIKYVNRMPNQEFAAYWAQETFTKNEELLKVKAVTEWSLTRGAKLLY